MAPSRKRATGDAVEECALRYLERQGLVTVQRNFSCRLGELDLIMRDGDCLAIVEVRFRSSRSPVPATLTVDHRKQQKILRTAAMFLAWNARFAALPLRFDVLGVDRDASGATTVNWIQDAFRPAGGRR